jgi:hypothetical protein
MARGGSRLTTRWPLGGARAAAALTRLWDALTEVVNLGDPLQFDTTFLFREQRQAAILSCCVVDIMHPPHRR